MPIYEYRCENGDTFESIQSFSDAPLTVCEICGAPVTRVLHPPAVQFKGSGFYNTDYGTRSREREKAAAGDNGASGGESKSAKDGDGTTAKPKEEKAAKAD